MEFITLEDHFMLKHFNRFINRCLCVFPKRHFHNIFNGFRQFMFPHERELFGQGGGVYLQRVTRSTNDWRWSCVTDRHGPYRRPRPRDCVFYAVFRAAASHVVFLQDQTSPRSAPPALLRSTAAYSGHGYRSPPWIKYKNELL